MTNPVKCPYCNRVFSSEKYYKMHDQNNKISCIKKMKIMEADKKYNEEHIDHTREKGQKAAQQRWCKKNKERISQYNKEYYQLHKQKYRDRYASDKNTS